MEPEQLTQLKKIYGAIRIRVLPDNLKNKSIILKQTQGTE